jgi:hypothetical protein
MCVLVCIDKVYQYSVCVLHAGIDVFRVAFDAHVALYYHSEYSCAFVHSVDVCLSMH